MTKFILSLDAGTTSSRTIIFDQNANLIAQSQIEFPQIYPKPGWVEHDPAAIWDTQIKTIREVLDKAGISAEDIAAVGITNQRETAIVWDKHIPESRFITPLSGSAAGQPKRAKH